MSRTELINEPNITVTLPDGQHIDSIAATQLQIPIIPQTATIAHLFPSLQPHSLLSVGQLCDVGCVATFDNQNVTIKYQDTTILSGDRNQETHLWSVPTRGATQNPNNPTGTPQYAYCQSCTAYRRISSLRPCGPILTNTHHPTTRRPQQPPCWVPRPHPGRLT
jgi:hypothetical protein